MDDEFEQATTDNYVNVKSKAVEKPKVYEEETERKINNFF